MDRTNNRNNAFIFQHIKNPKTNLSWLLNYKQGKDEVTARTGPQGSLPATPVFLVELVFRLLRAALKTPAWEPTRNLA